MRKKSKEELASKLNAECHAVVLDKTQMKPRKHLYILSEIEVRLYPNFHGLVYYNDTSQHRRGDKRQASAPGIICHISGWGCSWPLHKVWHAARHADALWE